MQFQRLPTPLDVLKRIWSSLGDLLLVLGILLVMSSVAQIALAVGGLIIAAFGHWIIGGILIVIGGLAYSTRKSSRF